MKVTVENNVKEYILDKIKNVYIGFDDNTEVNLNMIRDYDLDLNSEYDSTISFTNALNNVEMENHFKGNKSNHVIYVTLEVSGVAVIDGRNEVIAVRYDIPCDMKIRNYMISGNSEEIGSMHIELEGVVR